jgi:uncharacterized protein YndB with AHSA1/START domain
VKFHRVLAASPEKVFKAFIDADAMASWLPPYGFMQQRTIEDFDGHTWELFTMDITKFSTEQPAA